MVLCRKLWFFALDSVHQNPSFELSKSTIRQFFIFFTIRGDPCDLGGVKFYRQCFARSKIENKNSFGIRRASLTPWHMVQHSSPHMTQMGMPLMSTPGVLTVRDGASASAAVPGRQGQSLRQHGQGSGTSAQEDIGGKAWRSWTITQS